LKKFFLFLITLFILLLIPVSSVRVEFAGSVCYYPIESNSTLEVHYTHSVSLTKVVDVYNVFPGGLYFTQERWQEFLAGQPVDFDYKSGPFYVKNAHEFLGKSWSYWFIPVNNVTITLNGRVLFKQPPREGVLEIKVERIPFIMSIIRRC